MNLALGRRATWILLAELGLATVVLLWPAIARGHLLFGIDTSRHIGWDRPDIVEAPHFYNFWLSPMWRLGQTWFVALMQAGLYVALISLVLRFIAQLRRPGSLLAVTGVLAAGSYLPILVSMAMPDVFAAAGLLALALGLVVNSPLSRLALAGVVWLATLVHYSHLPVFAVTAAVSIPAALWLQRRSGGGRPVSWMPATLALIAALVTQVGATFLIHGRPAYSLAGPVFAVARLIEDGPAARYLKQRCPEPGLRMCELVDDLPVDAQGFLWGDDSFVHRSGGFAASSDEASRVLRGTVSAYPLQVASSVVANTVLQLSYVKAFPERQPAPHWYLAMGQRYPAVSESLASPFYFVDHYPPQLSDRLHQAVFGLSALGLLVLLPTAWLRGHSTAVIFGVTIIAGIVINSAVLGGISGTFPRYAARVAWLVPLAAMALAGLNRSDARDEAS